MLKKFHTAAACAAAVMSALVSVPAFAQDAGAVQYKFSGFGTVGAVTTDNADAQFRGDVMQFKGASNDLDLGVDSRIAIQGSVLFNPQFSITAQLLAQRLGDKDFDPSVEWFYGQYSPNDWLDVRLGRLVLPVFMVSDFRKVGYATHWLRAPQPVYGLLPFTRVDGLQALARFNLGDTSVSVQPTYGSTDYAFMLPFGRVDGSSDNVFAISATVEHGNWLLRAGQTRGTFYNQLPWGASKAKQVFNAIGAQYDNGKAVVMAEYVFSRFEPVSLDSAAWYVSAGWRFGTLLPYATYSSQKPRNGGQVAIDNHSTAVGLRFDAAQNVALKVQAERANTNSAVAFVPGAPRNEKVNALSVAADFVF